MRSLPDIKVERLDPFSRKNRKDFVQLQFDLSTSFGRWNPGLQLFQHNLINPKKNPFWKDVNVNLFLVRLNGKIVGRIGLLDKGYIPNLPDACTIIFPDFVKDKTVFNNLLKRISEIAKSQGAKQIIGPLNPNIHYDVGVQFSGFNLPNSVFMGYQPEYYYEFFEDSGFTKLVDFYAWELTKNDFYSNSKIQRLSNRVLDNNGLNIREVNSKSFKKDLEIFYSLYCKSFENHWGFASPNWEEFKFIASDIRLLLKKGMILIAEWENKPVGFVLSIPNIYEILPKETKGRIGAKVILKLLKEYRSIRTVRVMITGVLPEFRLKGVHLPLFETIANNIFDLGFESGELSWIMEGNVGMERTLTRMGAKRIKGYRIYSKEI